MLHTLLKNPSRLCRAPLLSPFSIFFSSSSSPEKPNPVVLVADYLVTRHNFSQESASKVSALVTHLKKPECSDSVLSYLKESGFSQTHVEKVITVVPALLSYNMENIRPKIRVFQDLGFSPSDIAHIFASDPWILTRSVDKMLGPSVVALESVLGSREGMSKLLKLSGRFLKHDLEKSLIPNIEFMKSCGISTTQITQYLYSFPRLFLLKTETVKDLAKRVDELGVDRKSKSYLCSIRVLGSMSMENWKSKLQLFKEFGLSEDDIVLLFRRLPQVFAVSKKKIKSIAQFLLNKGFDFSFAHKHPEILLCSMGKRLKPRLLVMETLEKKMLLPKKPAFFTMVMMSNKKFCEKYVLPYPDKIKKTYITNGGSICMSDVSS